MYPDTDPAIALKYWNYVYICFKECLLIPLWYGEITPIYRCTIYQVLCLQKLNNIQCLYGKQKWKMLWTW